MNSVAAARGWQGTARHDSFIFNDDSDTLDVVKAGAGRDIISDGADDGHWSDDRFYGQAGRDILTSTEGNDLLRGGKGQDTLSVLANWFDPADVGGSWQPETVEHGVVGFNVEVFGGRGFDTLTIENSEGYSIDRQDDVTIIRTVYGGEITVHGVEEFQFL